MAYPHSRGGLIALAALILKRLIHSLDVLDIEPGIHKPGSLYDEVLKNF